MNGFRSALRQTWRALRFSTFTTFRRTFVHELETFALALLLLGFAGCHREAPADVTIVNGNEPESLDPAIVTGISEMRLTKALFEGLLRLDPQYARPVAGLAERWEISPDRKVYTFFLRTNAVWSTGGRITSEDVLYSWFRALAPETAADYAGQLFYIKNAEGYYLGTIKDRTQVGIHALDERTVRVELNTPLAFFLDLCCFPTLAVVPRRSITQHGDRWLNSSPLPCSGPYQLIAWKPNDKVRLRKNPRYWDAANTQNEIVDVLPIGSPNAALNLYETGVADVVWDKDLVPTELLDVLMKRPDFHSYDYLGTFFYRFNVTRKPFDDPRVRRAFALATDPNQIIRKIANGGEKPAFHFVPDGVANYESPSGLAYNPSEARKVLAAAGFVDGKGFPRVEYAFYAGAGGAGQMQAKLAIELQEMWRENLGIEVELRQIERKIFWGVQSRLEYDLSASSWVGDYNDANTFLDLFMSNSGNNRTGWKSARYDELMRAANGQTDLHRRAKLLQEAEKILIGEETPIVPVYFYTGLNYFDPNKIKGIYQNLLDEHPLQNIRKIRRK
jgi:oligopeptide transport system substrate-binding protein